MIYHKNFNFLMAFDQSCGLLFWPNFCKVWFECGVLTENLKILK